MPENETATIERSADQIETKISELRSYGDYGTGLRADNKRRDHQAWIDALRWVLGSDLGEQP